LDPLARLPDQEEDEAAWRAFMAHALPAIPEGSRDPTDQAVVEVSHALEAAPSPRPGRLVQQSGFLRGEQARTLTYRQDGDRHLYATGGPRFVLGVSSRRQRGDEVRSFTPQEKATVRERVDEQAGRGRRVVAYAHGAPPVDDAELGDLVFVGCAALEDPVRDGVRQAVERLREAGVRTVMVTGDQAATARQVAREVGLEGGTVVGRQLREMSDRELAEAAQGTAIFARVTPEQKLRLTEILKDEGEVVAVTGDGVNDAPALRTGHIGVAMGVTGTDVAREAADLVLTDDDFSHLPDGVAIGRKAYENFRKGITYYLSAKAILLTAFLVPLAVGRPFPFAPIQIIAIEVLMDLASSTIFITEAAEPGVMEQPPRRRKRFLSWSVAERIVRNMVGSALAILVSYFGSLALGYGVPAARTAAFATWLLGHIVLALMLKQERISLFERGLLANRFGVGWLVGIIALVAAMVQVGFVRSALETTGLAPAQWVLVLGGALVGGGWLEVLKALRRPTDW
jgi:Ca2+-transporting ATPase